MSLKQSLFNNLKNIPGWRTSRKLVVFSVDDYGNVRLHSKAAREKMDKAGLKVRSRFDAYDTLETREDLEYLYEVLSSVKDKNGNAAVFTPYALPCNIDFEAMADEDYMRYRHEQLPLTYSKLAERDPAAYRGAWDLWKEGIRKGLLAPQFHGREHFNLNVFEEKLAKRDHEVLTALQNLSYTSISGTGSSSPRYTAAFSFWKEDDLKGFPEILETGLSAFEEVYGYKAISFTPPAQKFHPSLEPVLKENGIQAMDRSLFFRQHMGEGKYKMEWNSTGYDSTREMLSLVRNGVFEPSEDRGFNWVEFTLKQVEAAFRWNKPVNISSHRVNFCGHIDPKNREKGLKALKELLDRIVKRWPDVEFISVGDLVKIMKKDSVV